MLFGNRRVEEELERIRKANLPPALPEKEAADITADDVEYTEIVNVSEDAESVDIGFTAKDVLAMIIAAFSIILPYALIFIGVTILFVYFFFRG